MPAENDDAYDSLPSGLVIFSSNAWASSMRRSSSGERLDARGSPSVCGVSRFRLQDRGVGFVHCHDLDPSVRE
jgi:hypothetical protein